MEEPQVVQNVQVVENVQVTQKAQEVQAAQEPEVQDTMPAAVTAEEILKTAPFDPRFPNTNQTRYCYQSYIDFYRCEKVKGEGYQPCQYFKKVYGSICPNAWVEKWDGQREEGSFAGHI